MISAPIIVLPRQYATRIVEFRAPMGILEVHADLPGGVFVVGGFTRGLREGGLHGASEWVAAHYLGSARREARGLWFRAHPMLHLAGVEGARRSGALPLDAFKDGVEGWQVSLNRDHPALALTYTQLEDGGEDWLAWYLSEKERSAEVIGIALVDEDLPLLAPVAAHWPLDVLAREHVVVLGAGSIGSHADDALVDYGVRRLTVVDSDRLLPHNFARHRAHPRFVGRHKVHAERARLLDRDEDLEVEALVLDVIYDADVIRALLAEASLVLVALDGISSRRVANHLARRAGTPAVFACVLENGALGEIVRVASPCVGCLACLRAELREQGGMEPEATLDRGYGAGTRHLPMTAVGGDLGLVGQLAAKAAVATLLLARGYRDQRLPGDHAVIGLRPLPSLAAPFDVEHAGEIKWSELPDPRPDCATCSS